MKLDMNIFRIETNHVAPQRGHVLIAEPFLAGSYFNRSIIILASYSEKGAVGFILNKKVDYPVEDLFVDFPDFDSEIHIGGPVGTDSIYFIHTLGDSSESCIVFGKMRRAETQKSTGRFYPSDSCHPQRRYFKRLFAS
jgi:putative transcriptional regulator